MKCFSHAALGSVLALMQFTAPASAQVVQRDLQEFLDAQGTALPPRNGLDNTPWLLAWSNNPDINGDGVDEGPRYLMWTDYAGVLERTDEYKDLVDTTITGNVTERPIGDGWAMVTATLHTSGALTYLTERKNGLTGPTVFGYQETVLADNPDLAPALADLKFTWQFKNPVGAPMPDVLDTIFSGNNVNSTGSLMIRAEGPLTEEFGVPEGTLGKLSWGKPFVGGAFPNDELRLHPVMHREQVAAVPEPSGLGLGLLGLLTTGACLRRRFPRSVPRRACLPT